MSIHKIIFAITVAVSVLRIADTASAQGYYNPEIYDSGRRITDARYDPFTGKIIVRTDKTKVRESYLDPNRSQIDPGSYRNVNRYETDLSGVRWHVTGTQWTTNGVPHGNLSRRRMGGNSGPGGIVEDRNEHVAFGAKVNGNAPKPKTKPSTSRKPVVNHGSRPWAGRSGNRSYSPF
ncbi:hypothetical protein K227x_14040 [Rubripirellula lacrimiformis]|uniref:Uncharacterized protein n=1 Tax=Rubripirellula lacrimiformis TaxID=1930273 RepID=A0A517N7B8_9BACT|nr:hypothetical protein [Rubripirellula lacrimiformis]QDT03025.1 hypothetical protein K227x_14040 [Rubripirellula lacrimiformis]